MYFYFYLFLLGKLDPTNHTITGNSVAYIYPDMETALLGTFENRIMKAGRESSVQVLIKCKSVRADENFLSSLSASPDEYVKKSPLM
jgi:hypothetical protein